MNFLKKSAIAICLLSAGVAPVNNASAVPMPNTDINSYVLFAYDNLIFKGGDVGGTRGIITGGNVGVNNVDTSPGNSAFILSFSGRVNMVTDGTMAVADSFRSNDADTSLFDVFANDTNASFAGTIRNSGPNPFTAPLIDPLALPTLPFFVAGATDVHVDDGLTQNLSAGDYAGLRIDDHATLNLGPGVYNILYLSAGKNVTINTVAGTIVNIVQDMHFNDQSLVQGELAYFNVLSKDVDPNSRSVTFGHNTEFHGFVFNPNGEIGLGGNNDLFGHFWGQRISGDPNNNVTHVPEPASLLLLASGVLGAAYKRRSLSR